MNAAGWRKRMMLSCLVLLPLGVAAVVGGSIWLGTTGSAGGFALGSFGVLAAVVRGLCGKFALVGPIPKKYQQHEEPVA